jgi:hypothetical protein
MAMLYLLSQELALKGPLQFCHLSVSAPRLPQHSPSHSHSAIRRVRLLPNTSNMRAFTPLLSAPDRLAP